MSTKLKAGTASSGAVLDADTAGILELQSGSTPTTAITIDASQNVGVGTASPVNSSNYKTLTLNGTNGGQIAFQAGGTTTSYLYNTSTAPFIFYTNSAEAMRIDSSGSVGIGASPSNAGKLCIDAPTNDYNIITVKDTGTTYSTSNRYVAFYNSTNGVAGQIQHTAVTTVAYVTSSDERLKENIVDAPSALNKIINITVRSYDWKADKSHVDYGFIAQELEKIYSEPVSSGKDDVNQNPWSVEYGRLTPILVKAIQEQQVMIEELKTKVAALEAK